MIPAITLLALCALVPAQAPEATLSVSPAEVAIGQPALWTLSIRHAVNDTPVALADPVPDGTWVLIDGPRRDRTITGRGSDMESALTTMRWTVMSLASGERELPALEVRLEGGDTVVAQPESLVVTGELEEGEDAPRPMADFHAVEERTSGLHWTRLWLIGFAATLVVGGVVLFTRPRKRGVATPPPSPRERLRSLTVAVQSGAVDAEGGARDVAIELHGILRGAVDERFELSLAGRTDEEWCEVVRASVCADGRLPADTLRESQELLEWCAEVSFGGVHPTRFRVEEQLERAAGVLDALGAVAETGTETATPTKKTTQEGAGA